MVPRTGPGGSEEELYHLDIMEIDSSMALNRAPAGPLSAPAKKPAGAIKIMRIRAKHMIIYMIIIGYNGAAKKITCISSISRQAFAGAGDGPGIWPDGPRLI
jgi:hypothetical protein